MEDHTYRINKAVMSVDPLKNPNMNPKLHLGLWPCLIEMRQELYYLDLIKKQERRERMKKLVIADTEFEDTELRKLSKAYMYTQL